MFEPTRSMQKKDIATGERITCIVRALNQDRGIMDRLKNDGDSRKTMLNLFQSNEGKGQRGREGNPRT